jgi:hypothetical protein
VATVPKIDVKGTKIKVYSENDMDFISLKEITKLNHGKHG